MLPKHQMTIVFKYHCVTEFLYVYQAKTNFESLFETNFTSLSCC